MVKLYPLRAKGGGAGCVTRHMSENDFSLATGTEASLEGHELDEYYGQGAAIVGEWRGKLAGELGFAGKIETEEERKRFSAAIGGYIDRKPITVAGGRQSVTAWDVTMSAPKSVSIVGLFDPRVAEAFRDSLTEAFDELEKFAARRVRSGANKYSETNEITGNIAGAIWLHDVSRTLDPQLHAHCVLIAATRGSDGKLYALQPAEQARAIRYLSRYQEAALARRLNAIGYKIELTRERGKIAGWRISGVPEEVEAVYSERASQIKVAVEAELKRRQAFLADWKNQAGGQNGLWEWLDARGEHWSDLTGRTLSGAEITTITRQTRGEKPETTPAGVLRQQLGKLSEAQRQALKALVPPAGVGRPVREDLGDPWAEAVEATFERQHTLPLHKVLAEAITRDPLMDPDELSARARELPTIVEEARNGLASIVSSGELVAKERRVLELAQAGAGKHRAYAGAKLIVPPPRLGADQKAAFSYVASSTDQVMMIEGIAGAGKTVLVKAVADYVRREGQSILFLSPTRGGVEALKNAGLQAETIASYLSQRKKGRGHVPQLLVVDEAGMVGLRDGAALLEDCAAKGTRILLLGDIKQHQSIPAGDWMRLLKEYGGVKPAKLTEVRRQSDPTIRDAVKLLDAGKIKDGLSLLNAAGKITFGSDYLRRSAQAYLADVDADRPSLVIAKTWAEIGEITEEIRRGLKARGKLSEEDAERQVLLAYDWTKADAKSIRSYAPGMAVAWTDSDGSCHCETVKAVNERRREIELANGERLRPAKGELIGGELASSFFAAGDKIRVRQNNRALGLTNGEVLTVDRVSDDGSIETREGKRIPREYVAVTHGYARTSMASQGLKSSSVIVAAHNTTARELYVGVSRAVAHLRIFAPDAKALHASVAEGFTKRDAVADLTRRLFRPAEHLAHVAHGRMAELARNLEPAVRQIHRLAKRGAEQAAHLARQAVEAARVAVQPAFVLAEELRVKRKKQKLAEQQQNQIRQRPTMRM